MQMGPKTGGGGAPSTGGGYAAPSRSSEEEVPIVEDEIQVKDIPF